MCCLPIFFICSKKHTNNAENLDTIMDAPLFSLDGQYYKAKVVSVYDGDTITIIFKYKFDYVKWKCRLLYVDTPEIKSNCELEKQYAITVRNILRDKILNKTLKIRCGGFDKYGRLLIEIFDDNGISSINHWLITNNYAFEYDGKTKKSWKDYLETSVNIAS